MLEGATARDLYKAMKAKAQDGVCGERGDLTKRSGGVQCTMVRGGKEYHCAFGVELDTQHVGARRGLLNEKVFAIPQPSLRCGVTYRLVSWISMRRFFA